MSTGSCESGGSLELRAASMRFVAQRGAVRKGKADLTVLGPSSGHADTVRGNDRLVAQGMLEDGCGGQRILLAQSLHTEIGGDARIDTKGEDSVVMAGSALDLWQGGALIAAAMSDDLAAGLGIRVTSALDLWLQGVIGTEERPGTCMADLVLADLCATLYEREYGTGFHAALCAVLSGTTVVTMRSGFRPLLRTAFGVRNLIPGSGAAGSPPDVAPPGPVPGTAAAGAGAGFLDAGAGAARAGSDPGAGADLAALAAALMTLRTPHVVPTPPPILMRLPHRWWWRRGCFFDCGCRHPPTLS